MWSVTMPRCLEHAQEVVLVGVVPHFGEASCARRALRERLSQLAQLEQREARIQRERVFGHRGELQVERAVRG
jgi:hypothetical protein